MALRACHNFSVKWWSLLVTFFFFFSCLFIILLSCLLFNAVLRKWKMNTLKMNTLKKIEELSITFVSADWSTRELEMNRVGNEHWISETYFCFPLKFCLIFLCFNCERLILKQLSYIFGSYVGSLGSLSYYECLLLNVAVIFFSQLFIIYMFRDVFRILEFVFLASFYQIMFYVCRYTQIPSYCWDLQKITKASSGTSEMTFM